jgi:hypothetical protein
LDYPLSIFSLYQGPLTSAAPDIWVGIHNDAMSLNLDPDLKTKQNKTNKQKKQMCLKISILKGNPLIIMATLPLFLLTLSYH